jgi:hypothetical protein
MQILTAFLLNVPVKIHKKIAFSYYRTEEFSRLEMYKYVNNTPDILPYLTTPYNKVYLEEQAITHLVIKFPTLYGIEDSFPCY